MMIMSKKKSFSTRYLFFIVLYLLAGSTPLIGAELANVVVRNSADGLLIDIKLKGVFTEDMKAAVSKGVPIEIAFSVSLYEIHNFWFDDKMISKTAYHQIRFDALKKEYQIRRSWEKRGFKAEKDPGAAQKILSEIKGLKVIPLKRLEKGAHYQLRIKSELQDRSYIFSGTPWEFETDWYTINFIY